MFQTTVYSPAGNFSVVLAEEGEHHMGCATIWIRPSRPIQGIEVFQTTNGYVIFSPDGRYLFIGDANVILAYQVATEGILHWCRPGSWYFTSIRIEGDSLCSDLYDGLDRHKKMQPIPLAEIETVFAPGLGPAASGRLPSAYP